MTDTRLAPAVVGLRIYVIHAFRGTGRPGEREANKARISAICKTLLALGALPISPVHMLDGLFDDTDPVQREQALRCCESAMDLADVAWAFGETSSEGCTREIVQAQRLRKPLRFVNQTEPWWPREDVCR